VHFNHLIFDLFARSLLFGVQIWVLLQDTLLPAVHWLPRWQDWFCCVSRELCSNCLFRFVRDMINTRGDFTFWLYFRWDFCWI